MKYKTYKWVLGLFLVLFFSVIVLFSVINFNANLKHLKESYLREYQFLVNSITKDMIVLEGRVSDVDQAIEICYKDYGNRYMRQDIFLQVYNKDECVYSALTDDISVVPSQIVNHSKSIVTQIIKLGKQKYIRISGYLPDQYDAYAVVYYTNITQNIDQSIQQIIILLVGATIFSAILSVCLLVLIEHLFRPLEKISTASKRIADGCYEEKLDIKGEGEIGEVVLSFNTMADTIQKQIKELENNADEKQMLIDNLAHELRTPLTAIYGYAEYIQKTKLTEQDKYESTQFILHESKRLRTISEMLLNLAVLREEVTIEKRSFDFNDLLKRLHQLENVKMREKDIHFNVSNEITTFYGNEELIEGMLINLTDNAIKACDKQESRITLNAYEKEGHKVIEVIDNGKGMTKEQARHVTQAFYRVDKSRSRSEGGNGLGLTLCQMIADKHEAKLIIESEKGKGTKISIHF